MENAMPDEQTTPAPESTAPVATDSQPASEGPDATGLPGVPSLFGDNGNGTAAAPPSDAAPTAEPAADEAVPEAVQEADDDGDTEAEDPAEPTSDRRQRRAESRQAAEAARKAEVAQAVADALAARDQASRAQAALAARQAEEDRVMQQAAALMGGSEDENALIDAVASGDFDAADKLKDLRKRKADSAVLATAFDRMAWGKVYTEIQSFREIPGVDPDFMDKVRSLRELGPHIAATTRKLVEAEWSAKLDRQKADYESRLGRAASQLPTTETGGRAVGAGGRTFTRADIARMDTKTYQQHKAAIREQEARGLIH